MNFLDCIRTKFNHVKKSCREEGEGHRVNLRGLRPNLIVKADHILLDEPSCDCIIFVATTKGIRVAVVELKGKLKDIHEIVDKFRSTFKLLERMADMCGENGPPWDILPIVYHEGIHPAGTRELKLSRSHVTFRNVNYRVIAKGYKIALSQVISKFS
ncbi:MAG: hypothetical protein FJY85_21205 [Deltaproteobacteria bacterium]|nr:hypothetical protein [Deltaproteobacteria bacterium]